MAAQRAMSRLGPGELTLADIADGGRRHRRPAGAAVRLEARSAAGAVAAVFRRHRARCLRSCAAATARRWRRCGPTATAWRTWPRVRRRSRATSPTCRSISPTRTSGSTWSKHAARDAARAAEAHQGSDRRRRTVAGYQCQATGAHHRGGGRRLDDELGLLPGRHRREMDAPRSRRHPETLPDLIPP